MEQEINAAFDLKNYLIALQDNEDEDIDKDKIQIHYLIDRQIKDKTRYHIYWLYSYNLSKNYSDEEEEDDEDIWEPIYTTKPVAKMIAQKILQRYSEWKDILDFNYNGLRLPGSCKYDYKNHKFQEKRYFPLGFRHDSKLTLLKLQKRLLFGKRWHLTPIDTIPHRKAYLLNLKEKKKNVLTCSGVNTNSPPPDKNIVLKV